MSLPAQMDRVAPLLETGRRLLRDNPALTEADFRYLLLDHFRANDQALQNDATTLSGTAGDTVGLLALLLLPWHVFRFLKWRRRLARHRADLDETVHVLRLEGHFLEGTG